MNFENY